MGMILGCLMAVASGHKTLVKSEQCGPDETTCPTGCCPEANWYCCCCGMYMCAATAADCPFAAMSEKLTKMAANKQCGPDETTCPNGCCPVSPELNWYCCDDYCAPTAADCPFVAMSEKLTKMAANKQCDGDGVTTCPAGCCYEANWYCCPDNMYCAATPADCPFVTRYLSKLAGKKLN